MKLEDRVRSISRGFLLLLCSFNMLSYDTSLFGWLHRAEKHQNIATSSLPLVKPVERLLFSNVSIKWAINRRFLTYGCFLSVPKLIIFVAKSDPSVVRRSKLHYISTSLLLVLNKCFTFTYSDFRGKFTAGSFCICILKDTGSRGRSKISVNKTPCSLHALIYNVLSSLNSFSMTTLDNTEQGHLC